MIFEGGADLLYVVEVDPEDKHDEEGNGDEDDKGDPSPLHKVCSSGYCRAGGQKVALIRTIVSALSRPPSAGLTIETVLLVLGRVG